MAVNVYVVVCDGFGGGCAVLAIDRCGPPRCVDKLWMPTASLIWYTGKLDLV